MKKNNITTNIGTLGLGNMTFNEDCISVLIDICDMSDNLKDAVTKAIEIAKTERIKEWENIIKEMCAKNSNHRERLINELSYHATWSDKIVIDCTYLDITIHSGNDIDYSIEICFHDENNHRQDGHASIAVDLSEYQNELKKIIVKAMVDKFF